MSKPRPLNKFKFGPWLLKGLAAAAFLTASVAKLSGAPMMVHEFNVIGFGQGFRIVTGLIELSGVALLLIPQTTRIGASVLFAVCVGALGAQTLKLHGDLIHVFVLMALTGFLAWRADWQNKNSRRPRLEQRQTA
jgi:putative oxidoreductase